MNAAPQHVAFELAATLAVRGTVTNFGGAYTTKTQLALTSEWRWKASGRFRSRYRADIRAL